VTIGVGSLGAPVWDALGSVVGAISIGGLLSRYEGDRKARYVRLVKDTASRISRELGYAASPAQKGGHERR
jgi:DNA-binding IclR family transcriptional regulator